MTLDQIKSGDRKILKELYTTHRDPFGTWARKVYQIDDEMIGEIYQRAFTALYFNVKSGKLDNADVIIGPLYSGPSEFISQFSKENKVTMVNPVSSNEAIVGDNPYSYLFKSAYSTQGREAAKYAAKKFSDNKKLFIFYERKF